LLYLCSFLPILFPSFDEIVISHDEALPVTEATSG
jgi:hypothetical protein